MASDSGQPGQQDASSLLAAYATEVSTLVNSSSGSTSYAYPVHKPSFTPKANLTGPTYSIETDCSGWVDYALNSVAPLHDAVLQAQRANPLFNGTATAYGKVKVALNEKNEPWTQADALQAFFSGGSSQWGAHDTNGFQTIQDISSVQAGDLIAYSLGIYTDPTNPNAATTPSLDKPKDTGHTMIVTGPAEQVDAADAAGHDLADPSETVWRVPVVDSSTLLHFQDNRITAASGAAPGGHGTGVGSGYIWFAVATDGTVQQVRFASGDTYNPNGHNHLEAVTVSIARMTSAIDLSQVPVNAAGQFVVSVLPNAEPVLQGTDYTTSETLTGQGSLLVEGGGTLRMTGQNDYVGNTEVSGARTTVVVSASDGLGADSGVVTLDAGTVLTFTGDMSFGHAIVLSGAATLSTAAGVGATITGGISGGTLVVAGGGTLTLAGADSYSGGTIVSGGDLDLATADAAGSGTITFAQGSPSSLTLDAGVVPANAIAGFTDGDTLDLIGFDPATATAAYDSGTGVLTVSDAAGRQAAMAMTGDFADEYLQLAQDASGAGVAVTLDEAPCFCPGTLILTDRGEVPVEDLKIGDRVMTAAGRPSVIRWLGYRSFSGRFVAGRPGMLPVCIRAGALADGVPRRDLHVSPLHSMLLDGYLVPAGLLLNGRSITQAESVDRLDYIHIELEHHAVVWAEGAASESFLDDGSRGMFHNAPEYARLYPDAPAGTPARCAPLLDSGYELDAICRRLRARAGLPDAAASHSDHRRRVA